MGDIEEISTPILGLLKTTIRAFYLDSHIVVINILSKAGYASEYTLSKEMGMQLEKVKMIANNLYAERFIRFEDRLFKQLKNTSFSSKKKSFPKIYKLRYWYLDINFLVLNLKKKIKNILWEQRENQKKDKGFFLRCPRKICQKTFSTKDLSDLVFNNVSGNFVCDNFLNLKVICGAQLFPIDETENSNKSQLKKEKEKETIDELKPIISMLLFPSNK